MTFVYTHRKECRGKDKLAKEREGFSLFVNYDHTPTYHLDSSPTIQKHRSTRQLDEARPRGQNVYGNCSSLTRGTMQKRFIRGNSYGIVNIVGVSFCVPKSLGKFLPSFLLPAPLSPRPPATSLHPPHPNRLLAAISPKPSIIPLMNGSTRFIARLEASASSLARLDSVVSKIARVTDGGATGGSVKAAPDGPFLPSCPRR